VSGTAAAERRYVTYVVHLSSDSDSSSVAVDNGPSGPGTDRWAARGLQVPGRLVTSRAYSCEQ